MSGVSNDSNRSFLNCDKEFEYLLWLLAGGESMTAIYIIVVTDIIYAYIIIAILVATIVIVIIIISYSYQMR